MLTNDIYPSAGTAYLNQLNLLTDQSSIREVTGYCAQFDTIIPTLTAREHLQLFARIRGVNDLEIENYVELLIQKLALQQGIQDRPAGGYSGGNKRKLCLGIALIGNPKIVFLVSYIIISK